MRPAQKNPAIDRLKRPHTFAVETNTFIVDWDVFAEDCTGSDSAPRRRQRVALKLRNVSVVLDVPGELMARLMQLHPDGTSDSTDVVVARMMKALRGAAEEMPAASDIVGMTR